MSSSKIPAGTFFEKKNKAAAPRNNAPTHEYMIITLSKLKDLIASSLAAAVVPKSAKATTIGPIAVPKEFTPPPRLTRLVPVEGSPKAMANGCAAVC